MKAVYGLVAIALFSLIGFWVVQSDATRFQVDLGPIEPPTDTYDPVRAGEETPPGYLNLLFRDAILPVYNPTFRPATVTDWDGDTMVIGVELDGEAKAYPVSFLNRREMVIDWIGGNPILVSW